MALTAHDLTKIEHSMTTVLEPTNSRLDRIDNGFRQVKAELDSLAAATNRKFYTVFADITMTREDLASVKQLVSEHGVRLTSLENRSKGNA